MANRNQDVVGDGGVTDKEGRVQVKNWRSGEYYEKLLNEEFIWSKDGMETLAATEGGPL